MPDEPQPIYTVEEVEVYAAEQDRVRRATNRSFVYRCIAWFFVIVYSIYVISAIREQRHLGMPKREMVLAISNARQAHRVLLDFEADYGHFPDDHTALKDPSLSGFTGSFSNDYLAQLMAGGYTTKEDIFMASNHHFRRLGTDSVISPPGHILEKNECGFSYVMVHDRGKLRGLNSKDYGALPVLVAPMVNQWGSCDAATFRNRGIYLRIDGSARSERLRSSDQKIDLGGGVTLFDAGPASYWGSLKPVVLLPER